MGFLSKLFSREPRPSAQAPSDEFPKAYDAIEHLLDIDSKAGDDGQWVTFRASGAFGSATIEIAGNRINFLKEAIDLRAELTASGQGELARRVTPDSEEHTLWILSNPTPKELARIVDLAFARSMRLGLAYSVQGERHG